MPFASVLLIFIVSLTLSLVITPQVRRLAGRVGLMAQPRDDRWHRQPVALLGGLAIAVSFVIGVGVSGWIGSLGPLLLCTALMFALGTADDVLAVGPNTKLVGQMIVASLLIYLSPAVSLTGYTLLDEFLAFAWIVGITNAFNLLDNIDGLAAGVAVIAGASYLGIVLSGDSLPLIVATAAFVGAVAGFLIFNFPPASIFMGDGGSLFLGSFLAAISFLVAAGHGTALAPVALVPLMVLLVPIFDTVFVTLTRGLAGRSALVGGRDHTSHRLVALGIGDRRAVVALYALAAVGGLVGIALQHVGIGYAAIVIGLYLIVLIGLGVVLGHVDASATESVRLTDARSLLLSELTYRYRIYEVLLDAALIGVSYYAAFRIRFDEPQFASFLPPFVQSFPIVVVCHLTGLWLGGKYKQVWSSVEAGEIVGILRGTAIGVAMSVLLVVYMYRFQGFSRGVFVIDGVMLAVLLVATRVAIARIDDYLRHQRKQGKNVLIYGAGRGGALLVRELLQNPERALVPVGFIDDDPKKRRLRVSGLLVLGSLSELPSVVRRRKVSEVLISIQNLTPEHTEAVAEICREHDLNLRRMQFALESPESTSGAGKRTQRAG
jgi:UDP-GlcNAc:undecaprenyl-phosphate GlcNAc-1-phosphate transferase